MSNITLKEIEGLLDEKLKPIHEKLSDMSKDLGEIKRGLGYDNLKLVKNNKAKM